ncbi:hypothetical protein CHUAL_005121 [Chamberlinius hualienensis]
MFKLFCYVLLLSAGFDNNLAKQTKCADLPQLFVDPQWILTKTLFTAIRGTWSIFQCTHLLYANPLQSGNSTTWTAIAVAESDIFSLELNLTDNTIWTVKHCQSGSVSVFKTSFMNFNGSRMAFCGATCGKDGSSYDANFPLGESTRCDQLPRLSLDPKVLLTNHLFYPYRGTWDLFRCTQIFYVNPTGSRENVQFTAICLSELNPPAFTFHINMKHNIIWNATYCEDGSSRLYTTPYINFNERHGSYCAVSCGADGASYEVALCLASSIEDEASISDFLEENEIPNTNLREGCVKDYGSCTPNTNNLPSYWNL